MTKIFPRIFLPFAALLLFAAPLRAAEPTAEELARMSFVEMVNSVDVSKYTELVQKFQKKEAQSRLMKDHFRPGGECNVETYRNKEVLLVTIPAHLLFAPNSTELCEGAAKWLEPFRRYLKDPDMFRVVLAMHTDNTGSEEYRDQLTLDRVDAVYDWFEEAGADTRYLFPFAMGDEYPLRGVDNTSMENRDRNRRLEVYLVPGAKMLEQAKKGRIEF